MISPKNKDIRASRLSLFVKKNTENKATRLKPILLLLLFIVSFSAATALPLLKTDNASAITAEGTTPTVLSAGSLLATQNNSVPNWFIQSESYADAIQACFSNSELSTSDHWYTTAKDTRITYSNAKSGNWFGSKDKSKTPYANTVMIGNYMKDSPIANDSKYGDKIKAAKWDGKVWCNNSYLVSSALNLWGLDPVAVLCNSGFTRYDNGTAAKDDTDSCENAPSSFDFEYTDKSGGDQGSGSIAADAFISFVLTSVYGSPDADTFPQPLKTDSIIQQDIVGARWYLFYRHTLNESCAPGIDSTAPSSNLTGGNHLFNGVRWIDSSGNEAPGHQYLGSSSYNTWDNTAVGPVVNDGNVGQAVFKCSEVVSSMNSYADSYAAWHKDVAQAGGTANNGVGGGDNGAQTKSTTSCAINGIGWIVCPVLTFVGGIADNAFNFLATDFLSTNVSLANSNPSNGNIATYNAWQTMRNIANVAFVIVFLIIIFSQITGFGIDNYGIKKMFPKLIIAAILVNVSFFICQIGVDLSNILGYSLKSLFDGLGTSMGTPGSPLVDASGNPLGWAVIIAAAIAGGVALLLAISVPVLLAAFVAMLMIVLILMARTALIVLLIVISPLAFVAYLLPNTEQWFKKWGKTFTSLLLVFPIIAILFGAGGLAAKVLNASAGNDKLLQVIAMGVAVVPLFAVPSLLKGSMNAAGSIGTKLAGISSKANGRIGGKVKETSKLGQIAKYHTDQANLRRAQIQSGSYKGWNPIGKGLSSANRALYQRTGKYGTLATTRGYTLEDSVNAENVKNSESLINHNNLTNTEKVTIAQGGDIKKNGITFSGKNNAMRQAAIKNAVSVGTVQEVESIITSSGSMTATQRKELTGTMVSSGITNKAVHLGAATLGDIEQGDVTSEADLDRVTIRALQGSKFSAEKLATNEPYSLDRVARVITSNKADFKTPTLDPTTGLYDKLSTAEVIASINSQAKRTRTDQRLSSSTNPNQKARLTKLETIV